jgi:hypothetical protein
MWSDRAGEGGGGAGSCSSMMLFSSGQVSWWLRLLDGFDLCAPDSVWCAFGSGPDQPTLWAP